MKVFRIKRDFWEHPNLTKVARGSSSLLTKRKFTEIFDISVNLHIWDDPDFLYQQNR